MIFIGITTSYCDGLRYIAKNLKEYNCTMFIGVPALVEGIYKNINREIDKQRKLINNIIKVSEFLRKFGIDIRRTLFRPILDKIGGLRLVISGASALNPEAHKGLDLFGINVLQGYGLTETSPILAAENFKERKIRKCWKTIS